MLYDHLNTYRSADEDIRLLRENGCYWPSDEEVSNVFSTLCGLTVWERLKGEGNVSAPFKIDFRQFMKSMTGTERDPDLTGHFGYEFSGFFCELQLLRRARFINFEDTYVGGEKQLFMWLTQEALAYMDEFTDNKLLHYEILRECTNHVHDLQNEIEERARRFGLIDLLLRFAFRYLREPRP